MFRFDHYILYTSLYLNYVKLKKPSSSVAGKQIDETSCSTNKNISVRKVKGQILRSDRNVNITMLIVMLRSNLHMSW